MPQLWSIVLAAGQGRRLAALTGGVPKQFWSPDGDRTLLEQTLDRLAPLVPPKRTMTVIDRSHRALARTLWNRASLGHLLEQPDDRGTAPGVLLGLSEVIARDPEALVLVSPSDHGIARPAGFRTGIRRAMDAIGRNPRDIILFGVRPTSPVGDYGWITSSQEAASGAIRPVTTFVEKPALEAAETLLRRGAVWNTMVMVAHARALLALFEQQLPATTDALQRAWAWDPRARAELLNRTYVDLPRTDFSRDVLTPAHDLSVYTWPPSLGWTDLGTPSRLAAWLDRQDARTADAEPALQTCAQPAPAGAT